MNAMCETGVDADEMPNGTGEYGLTATNPIPCRTIIGSTAYLGRLRAADGAKVSYDRLGSTQSSVSPHLIDIYRVNHPSGRELATLYISPYQKRISGKAPRGFILAENSFAQASPQCIRLESTRVLFESIFPIISESGEAMLDLHELTFGASLGGEDSLMLTLRLITFDVDAQTGERRIKDVLEQDIIIGNVPLPRGPSILSRSYREAVINLRHVVQQRFKLLDLSDAMPADLCFFDESKISHLWELADQ
jgi:hypothetical protein